MHSEKPIALVVDDEPLIRMGIADLVTTEGFKVIEAGSADEALSLVGEYQALQLLLTDIQMPGKIDGLELARQVCERRPEVNIVVSSGAVHPVTGQMPPNARFLGKPVSHPDLRRVIQEIAQNQR